LPDQCAKGIDRLPPGNLIIFSIGLATDVKPMSLAADWINRGGYDAIIIRGQNKHLTLLEVTHERVSLHDAGDLWGTRYY